MELFNKQKLKDLIKINSDLCISIYMSTHKEWDKLQQDKTLFKNQIQEVKDKLRQIGYKETAVKDIIFEAEELLGNEKFWQHQSDGLAIFISPGYFQYFLLPRKFKAHNSISYRFYVKPLIPLISDDGRYYLLSLELSESKLYLGSKYSLSEISLPKDTPISLEDAVSLDEPEKSIQFHTGTGGSVNSRPAIFHGHGTGSDEKRKKKDILRFFQMLNKGVMEVISNDNAPLITIGVEYLHPIYKEANSYPKLESYIDADPKNLKLNELNEKAWNVVNQYFQKQKNEALEEYGRKSNEKLVSTELHQIVKGSLHQQVDKLFIDIDHSQWGKYDQINDKLTIDDNSTPENEDLHDLIIMNTIENNGTVYALDKSRIPNGNILSAIFRYSVNQ